MKNDKHNAHKSEMNSMNSKQPPNDQIKPVEEEKQEESPQVFKIVKRSFNEPGGRRKFLKAAAGAAGLTLVTGVLGAKCGPADDDSPCTTEPVVAPVACGCQAVCTCDYDGDQKIFTKWDSVEACTCDTVCLCNVMETCDCDVHCTCDGVCTCDGQCTCDGHCTCDSQGGHYWYPN